MHTIFATVKKLKNLILHRVGSKFVMVDKGPAESRISNVYNLNETAAWLWDKCDSPDFDLAVVAGELVECYEVDYPTAIKDIKDQLAQWQSMGLIEQ